ncbi:MAG: GNAT family N-acetyltransferase [Novosphingobium sp.]|nr:GNAT family N-acetyltransferase [Novosphingobium sp.]
MTVTVRPLTGAEIGAALADLASLRIAVFAAYPYLYDGDAAYEAAYLAEYAAAADAVLVAAFDGARIVGAATAAPMIHQKAEFREPFAARLAVLGLDVERLFYFGESVLLPEYRGQGIGHAFFDHREAQARRCGANAACFAAVIRPEDHRLKPPGYMPHDAFWTNRGYAVVPGLVTELAWKEHGEAGESLKAMQYWLRSW